MNNNGFTVNVGFARHHWRAWIETVRELSRLGANIDSPAITGGRGLKRDQVKAHAQTIGIRPPLLAGVD